MATDEQVERAAKALWGFYGPNIRAVAIASVDDEAELWRVMARAALAAAAESDDEGDLHAAADVIGAASYE